MLPNPFTPSQIADNPNDFFGRGSELTALERSLSIGFVAIDGGIGIGKSSLLTQICLRMNGFVSEHSSEYVIAVGDKGVSTVDDAARLLLEEFSDVDERQNRIKFKLGTLLEMESAEICSDFRAGRHLAALKRIVEETTLSSLLRDKEFLILGIDEADKCPVPLTQLIRSIATHTQHKGIKSIRFVLAGVSPFFQRMVDEDQGINRFFYKTISLAPMPEPDALLLVETKLRQVVSAAAEKGTVLRVDPSVINRVVNLSGGHPHLLQLLGSHLVENEDSDPDGVIDSKDLANTLRRICYEDRARVYDATLHLLELNNALEPFGRFLELAAPGFPTRVNRQVTKRTIGKEVIEWLVTHNILRAIDHEQYGLVDEFVRVRLEMDELDKESERLALENDFIDHSSGAHTFARAEQDELDYEDMEEAMHDVLEDDDDR